MSKKKGGRRSKYETHVEPRLFEVECWARDGMIDKDIAKKLGVAYSTFRTYVTKFPALSASLKKGKEVVDYEVENALLKRALGFHYVEELASPMGDVVEVTRYEKPDVTAAIFWLKNRKAETWRNKELVDVKKVKAETNLIEEKTKLIKGETKDTSMLDALVEGRKQYEQMMKERENNE